MFVSPPLIVHIFFFKIKNFLEVPKLVTICPKWEPPQSTSCNFIPSKRSSCDFLGFFLQKLYGGINRAVTMGRIDATSTSIAEGAASFHSKSQQILQRDFATQMLDAQLNC